MVPRLRIFLSSPADVNWERLRAHLIIRRLARDYRRYFIIEPFLWEYEPMLASQHFQDAIEPPGNFDIVVLMVWSRLGTQLPERTAVRDYRGIDGRAPVTGTEWEFEDALRANRAIGGKGPPDLLVYRRRGGAVAALDDPARRAEAIRQYDALEAFWQRWFKDGTGFLAGYAGYQDAATFDRKLESDLRALIERRIKERRVDPGAPAWLTNSPFRGLKPYEFDDAPVFFGRHGEIGDGLTRLLDAAERGTAFLLVSGPSGSGKSSLARAGLLPALVTPKTVSGVGLWRRAVMRPGDAAGSPILALVHALAPDRAHDDVGLPELLGTQMTREELAGHLASGGNPAFLFARTLRDLAATERTRRGLLPHEQARLVLLIDQLEEFVTRPEIGAEQRRLFARIVAALAGSGVVWVIATVRSDLWHRLEDVQELRDLAERGARLTLAAPDAAQLFDIIRKPAQAAGLTFDAEPGTELPLDAMIAREAEAQPGVLPLLSVLLHELYDRDVAHDGGSAVLTVASYRALGGLRAAIGQRAESRLLDIQKTDPAAAAALPRVLRALVTVTASGDAPAARSAPLTTFAGAGPEHRLVEALIAPDARLLIAEDRGRGPEVRLAHEALIGNWPRAQAIVAESGHFIRLRDDIEAQRRRWQAAKYRPELLLASGLPLTEARDLVKKFGAELSPGILAFIKASRRRAQGRQQLAAAVAVIALTSAGSGAWWWDQNLRIKTRYCANYGERWAVPFCVGPLDEATQAARAVSYRFRTQGGRVLEMTRVNGSGAPVVMSYFSYEEEPWVRGVARWHFSYRSEARGAEPSLASVTMEGPTGVRLRAVNYAFSDDDQQAVARFSRSFDFAEMQAAEGSALALADFGSSDATRLSGIGQHHLWFDDTGLLVRRDFQSAGSASTMADALGSYGRAYEYGDKGLPVRVRNLDGQGNTLVEKSGIAGQFHEYDVRGDLVTGTWLDRDRMPCTNRQNFARFVWIRDGFGNVTAEEYYTKAGVLTERTDTGAARVSAKYDGHGNMVDQAFFGANGNPVLFKANGYARLTARYDERGNRVDEAYFGVEGKPVLGKNGAGRVTARFDERGNQTEIAYFGTDGKPVFNNGGYSSLVANYDKRHGNITELFFFGTDGKPILAKLGVEHASMRYDDRGNLIEFAFFGADGRPASNKGIARTAFKYDDRGNKVEDDYFGADGMPIVGKEGYASVVYRYDEHGNQIEWADFGIDGMPVSNNNGIARTVFRYDDRGNKVEETFFGADGLPILSKGGYARTTYQYDERGNQVEWSNFGMDGMPVSNSNGVARTTFRYDDRGNKTEEDHFGPNGMPITNKDGFARVSYRYDERGNKVEEAFFGLDGMPILHRLGYARVTIRYDDRGNPIELTAHGTDGEPVPAYNGIARINLSYDERSNRVETAFFGPDGNPALTTREGISRAVARYDQRGYTVELTYFGPDGRLLLRRDAGVAGVIFRYDERGNKMEEAYVGADGKPVLGKQKFARLTNRYDERGNLIEENYFGIDGMTAENSLGIAHIVIEYDAKNHVIKHSFFGVRGPVVVEQIGAGVRDYNRENEVVGLTYLDDKGHIIPVEVECVRVEPGTVAGLIGLASGDRLLAYDGETVKSREQFTVLTKDAGPGVHKLTVRRGDAVTTHGIPAGRLGVLLTNVRAERQPTAAPLASPP